MAEHPDLDGIAQVCVCLHARMTARAVTRAFDHALKPFGLEATQFSLLAAMLANPAGSVTALADRLALERTSLSRNLRVLLQRGLIAEAGRQGRAVAYAVTADGERLIAEALPTWRAIQERVVSGVGPEGWTAARDAMRMIRKAAHGAAA